MNLRFLILSIIVTEGVALRLLLSHSTEYLSCIDHRPYLTRESFRSLRTDPSLGTGVPHVGR